MKIFLQAFLVSILSILLAIFLPLAVVSTVVTNVYEKALSFLTDYADALKNEAYPK